MSKQIDALKLALEALNTNRVMAKDSDGNYTREITPKLIVGAITAIKEALAQQSNEQVEPYCWTWDEWITGGKWRAEYGWKKPERQVTNLQPLFIHPPVPTAQPEQEPVTLEAVYETIIQWDEGGGKRSRRELARRIMLLFAHTFVEPVPVHQFRTPYSSDWYDGIPDHHDGHGPYEIRTLYTTPPQRTAAEGEDIRRAWVGLTWEDANEIAIAHDVRPSTVKAIEAKLKEKNT